jgi:hypothetical protein
MYVDHSILDLKLVEIELKDLLKQYGSVDILGHLAHVFRRRCV